VLVATFSVIIILSALMMSCSFTIRSGREGNVVMLSISEKIELKYVMYGKGDTSWDLISARHTFLQTLSNPS
jgi:hypothetical protein